MYWQGPNGLTKLEDLTGARPALQLPNLSSSGAGVGGGTYVSAGTGVGGWLAAAAAVAYRITVCRYGANEELIESEPSDRIVYVNALATADNPVVSILCGWLMPRDAFFRIYRSKQIAAGADPGDEEFLVAEVTPSGSADNYNWIAPLFGSTYTDYTADGLLGAPLYTNAITGSAGAGKGSSPAPLSADLAYFKDLSNPSILHASPSTPFAHSVRRGANFRDLAVSGVASFSGVRRLFATPLLPGPSPEAAGRAAMASPSSVPVERWVAMGVMGVSSQDRQSPSQRTEGRVRTRPPSAHRRRLKPARRPTPARPRSQTTLICTELGTPHPRPLVGRPAHQRRSRIRAGSVPDLTRIADVPLHARARRAPVRICLPPHALPTLPCAAQAPRPASSRAAARAHTPGAPGAAHAA